MFSVIYVTKHYMSLYPDASGFFRIYYKIIEMLKQVQHDETQSET